MLVNAINGGEVDCIFAALSAPLQEDFIMKNRVFWMPASLSGWGKLR